MPIMIGDTVVVIGHPKPPTFKEWRKRNKALIDAVIEAHAPGARKNDGERRLWTLNYEPLYNLARADGVKI